MKIVTIIEDNPITGVRYGVVDVTQYNNNTQRRINRRIEFYNNLRRHVLFQTHRTKHK